MINPINSDVLLEFAESLKTVECEFEESTKPFIKLYPTKEDFDKNRGTIFIRLLESTNDTNIIQWIEYQELKLQLLGKRRCIKNQTIEERQIISKGIQIHKYILRHYKKLRYKCYHRFSDLSVEEKVQYTLRIFLKKCFKGK